MKSSWKRDIGTYGATVLSVTAAALLRWALEALVPAHQTPYVTFFLAIVVSAALGGLWQGIIATVLSGACAVLLLTLLGDDVFLPGDIAAFIVFLVTGTAISFALEALHRSHRRTWEAEARRQAQAEELRELVRLMDKANVLVLDLDHRIVRWNGGAEKLYGFTADQALGRVGHQLLKTEFPEPLDRIRARLTADGLWEGELVQRGIDGRRVVVASTWMLHRDACGKPSAILVITNDITAGKEAEEARRRSESLLVAVSESSEDAIYIKDRDSRLLHVNPAMQHMVGKPMDQIVGHTDAEFYDDPDIGAAILENDRRILEGGVPQIFEESVDGPNGRRVVLSSKVPWRDAEGRVIGIIGISRDITERKRMEEELREMKEVAEAASKSKDQFLAVLSHELRTPLTAVIPALGALKDQVPPAAAEYLEMARRNVALEVRLIDDLLDVTRIARGRIELDRKPVNLGTVIRRAAEVCAPDIESRRLEFAIEIEDPRQLVLADEARLQQVFWNLLKNSVKFTPPGGGVRVRAWREGERAVVQVTDHGEGIEPEALGRIFNAFEQADSIIRRKFGGLGLGLAISKAIVEMHGGSIRASSEGKGRGATFTVELPVLNGAAVEASKVPASGPPASAEKRPLRILLVEDHGDTARVLVRLLKATGYDVEHAADVATALQSIGLAKGNFDVLVSDLGLPDGTGYDLMREIDARGRRPKAIALSGYGMAEDVLRSREAGFDHHLTKPVDFPALLATIERIAR